jgi:hypothetical protein
LNDQELAQMYDQAEGWGEHPFYSMCDWRNSVADQETRLGYWQWVASLIDQEENGGEAPTPAGVSPVPVLNMTETFDPLESLSLSEDAERGPDGTLPPFDELQYRYFSPQLENGEAEGDYYGVVGFLDGNGRFSGLVPAGSLAPLVGPTLANKMVLGQGNVVRLPNVTGEVNPAKSLQVHCRDISPKDVEWLHEFGASIPRN